jgi:hypothetical protein
MVKPFLGSLAGTAVALFVAPRLKPWFSVPDGGVGWVTINGYPKSWDYAVIALLVVCAFAGGALLRGTPAEFAAPRRRSWPLALLVFVLMFFAHDHPNAPVDMFHEGEHLTPAWLMRDGARPYRDFFVLHGLGVDGGLDLLGPPRRVQALLDAATLALLVPIAAEVTATGWGMVAAVLASLCALGAGQVPVFPYHRLWPLLVATLALLRFVRTARSRDLLLAFCASTLGILYGLDTGTYALAGTIGVCVLLRIRRAVLPAVIAVVLAIVVLLLVRADLRQFFVDSFVHIPKAIDAVWALPAPPFEWKFVRYYLPPAFYGFLLAYALHAWRGGRRELASRIVIVAVLSIVAFRTAAGRVSWSHTRFATPLLGIAMVAFVLEPMRRRVVALVLAAGLFFFAEVPDNFVRSTKLIGGWKSRQVAKPQDLDLATLRTFINSNVPPGATIFDFSNERAVYAFVRRRPAARVFDVPMLSSPALLAETMAQLETNRPAAVIVEGDPVLFNFDGVSNRQRVPALAEWIDRNYPRRTQLGRYLVATP